VIFKHTGGRFLIPIYLITEKGRALVFIPEPDEVNSKWPWAGDLQEKNSVVNTVVK
jgi:hypothetical protein